MDDARYIYLVTSGDYSDYGIEAAFSTEEMAEKFAAEFNSDVSCDTAEVEKFVLDMPQAEWAVFDVDIDEGGDAVKVARHASCDSTERPRFCWSGRHVCPLRVSVRTNDKDRAIKVAAEKWAVIKATIPWGDEGALTELVGLEQGGLD